MRKFCKKHFLSFVRLREWRDIHRQLTTILKEARLLKLNQNPTDYGAIHRSILSGLLNYRFRLLGSLLVIGGIILEASVDHLQSSVCSRSEVRIMSDDQNRRRQILMQFPKQLVNTFTGS